MCELTNPREAVTTMSGEPWYNPLGFRYVMPAPRHCRRCGRSGPRFPLALSMRRRNAWARWAVWQVPEVQGGGEGAHADRAREGDDQGGDARVGSQAVPHRGRLAQGRQGRCGGLPALAPRVRLLPQDRSQRLTRGERAHLPAAPSLPEPPWRCVTVLGRTGGMGFRWDGCWGGLRCGCAVRARSGGPLGPAAAVWRRRCGYYGSVSGCGVRPRRCGAPQVPSACRAYRRIPHGPKPKVGLRALYRLAHGRGHARRSDARDATMGGLCVRCAWMPSARDRGRHMAFSVPRRAGATRRDGAVTVRPSARG